jgi:hypothetical protein
MTSTEGQVEEVEQTVERRRMSWMIVWIRNEGVRWRRATAAWTE